MPILIANLIGLAGYCILLWATQHQGKKNFLAIDFVGCLVVGVQYLLLGVISAAVLNAVYLLADSLALLPPKWRRLYPLVYPLTLVARVLGGLKLLTLFVALAGLLAFAGRQQTSMVRLRWLIMASALSFLVVGVIASSWAQVAFSLFYIAANLRQLYFTPKAIPPAPLQPAATA